MDKENKLILYKDDEGKVNVKPHQVPPQEPHQVLRAL